MNIDDINNVLILAIKGWNVLGLPVLLVFLAGLSLRNRGGSADGERLKTIARLGGIHLAMAFWSLTTIVSELWAFRTMGIVPTNPITGLFGSTILMVVDLFIGFGLLRRWKVAHWGAILWSLYRTAIAVYVGVWFWWYPHGIDWTEWPRDVLFWAYPPFEIAVLLAPGTWRLFRKPLPDEIPTAEPRPPWLSTLALVFLASAISAGLIDAVDWSVRTIAEAFLEA